MEACDTRLRSQYDIIGHVAFIQCQVGLLDIDATFSKIEVHFDNLVGGGDFGEVINQIISMLGNTIWEMVALVQIYSALNCRWRL